MDTAGALGPEGDRESLARRNPLQTKSQCCLGCRKEANYGQCSEPVGDAWGQTEAQPCWTGEISFPLKDTVAWGPQKSGYQDPEYSLLGVGRLCM